MAKTQVQKLTSAVLQLNQNPDDAAAAAEVSSLAQQIAPAWAAATKPEEMSAGRISSTSSWIAVAAVDPALAAQDGPTAAGALLALTTVLDELEEKGWMKYALEDDVIPSLEEVAEAIGGILKKGLDAVSGGMGALPWIVGGLAVAYFLTRRRR
ncbi:MAG: hypothetical protein R2847_13135 [Bacteroidia bacterium]